MIGPRIGLRIGPNIGPAVGVSSDGLGGGSPALTFSSDATSGIAVPANATEWSNFISVKGLTLAVPDALWLAQEASGNLADSIGTFTLTQAGAAPTYQASVTGWSRKGVATLQGTTTTFKNIDAGLPSVNTTSITILYFTSVDGAIGANRSFGGAGTTTMIQAQVTAAPVIVAADGANVANGTANPGGGVIRPLAMTHDKTGGTARVATDQEKLAPTISASVTGKQIQYSGAVGGALSPPSHLVYGCAWFGAHGEISDADLRALLQAMGWTIPW